MRPLRPRPNTSHGLQEGPGKPHNPVPPLYLCKALCSPPAWVGGQGGAGAGSLLSLCGLARRFPRPGGAGRLGACAFLTIVEGALDSHSKTSPLHTRVSFFAPEVPSRPSPSRPKPHVPCPGTAWALQGALPPPDSWGPTQPLSTPCSTLTCHCQEMGAPPSSSAFTAEELG